jgi:hypothetical protein
MNPCERKKKVIVNIQGGTGNQLFQVARGLALAKRTGGRLFISNDYCRSLKVHTGISSILTSLPETSPVGRVVIQKGWSFDEHVDEVKEDTNENLIVKGYYQSSKFFKEAIPEVLSLIRPHLRNPDLRKTIPGCNENTAVIHIRRGDYLKYKNIHPQLTKHYYLKAIKALRESLTIQKIIVCSDDLTWCRERPWIQSLAKEVIFPPLNVIQTLSLMEAASSHIIANSTLSWWGAYLATQRNPLTKVVAPLTWFGPRAGHVTRDIYEESWIVI